jgi:hypothetical protein
VSTATAHVQNGIGAIGPRVTVMPAVLTTMSATERLLDLI